MKTLETKRLTLRPFTDDDIDIHRQVFSDPEVCKFYCGRTRTEDETREWLIHRRWQAKSADELGFLAVVRKDDGQLLGLVALQLFVGLWLRLEDEPGPYNPLIVELSYALGREFHGQGYATEACEALVDHAFRTLRLPRLVNGVDAENLPSVKLCERLGFRPVANLHPDADGPVWVRDNHDLLLEGLPRWVGRDVQTRLAERMGAPPPDDWDQDWEWTVADAGKFEAWLALYDDPDTSDDERLGLMEVLVQCVEDRGAERAPAWEALRLRLLARPLLHAGTVEYWCSWSSDLRDPDQGWRVAPEMRALWAEIRPILLRRFA